MTYCTEDGLVFVCVCVKAGCHATAEASWAQVHLQHVPNDTPLVFNHLALEKQNHLPHEVSMGLFVSDFCLEV